MDAQGIDVEALSINPYWYRAERDVAVELIRIQNETLVEFCAADPDRFVAFATAALQYPDLAAQQVEHAVKSLASAASASPAASPARNWPTRSSTRSGPNAKSLACSSSCIRSAPASWKRAARLAGSGLLTNTIGNPLETTIALSHLIFEGTLDRFPGLKICAAHGGGFLPSYANRSDAVLPYLPDRVGPCRRKTRPPISRAASSISIRSCSRPRRSAI